MTASATLPQRRTIRSQFGIGRRELEELGLDKTHFLRLPLAVVAASVTINLLGMALPLAILQVYDRVIPHAAAETLLALVAGLAVVVIIDSLLRIARGHVVAWAAAQFSQQSLGKAMERILHTSSAAFSRDPASRHLQRLHAVQRLGDFYGGRSRLLLLDLPFVVFFVMMMTMIGGALVLVTLAVLVAFTVATVRVGRRLRRTIEQRDEQDAKIYDFIADALTGITTLKSMAMEPLMMRRFERLQRTAATIDYDTIYAAIRAEAAVATLGTITMVAMVTFGAILAIFGSFTIGTLSACTMLSGRVIQPILGAASLWNEVQKMRLGLDGVRELFALPMPDVAPLERVGEGPVAIELVAVGASVGERLLFQDVDLTIQPGELIALTGADGSGKADVLRLLSGDLMPKAGSLLIDGVDPAALRASKPGAISYVAHEPSFFRGTILDNLTLFGHGPTAAEARAAVGLVGAERDIQRLPLGFDTKLGEGIAETLSTGFLKKLSVARAIAMRPRLLLLDEPQAFLDAEADRDMIACLTRLRGMVTVVLTTTRPSYLSLADRVFACSDIGLTDVTKPAPAANPMMDAGPAAPLSPEPGAAA